MYWGNPVPWFRGPSATVAERSGASTEGLQGSKGEVTAPVWSKTTGTGISEGFLPPKPRKGRSGDGEARVRWTNKNSVEG